MNKKEQHAQALALCTAMRLIEDIGRTDAGRYMLKAMGVKAHEIAGLLSATSSFTDKMSRGTGQERNAIDEQQVMLVDLFLAIAEVTALKGGEGVKAMTLEVTRPNGILKVEATSIDYEATGV